MTIDPIAGGAPPRVVIPAARPVATQRGTGTSAGAAEHQPPAAQPPHTVELSFHQDLRVLMTRVIEATTGNVLAEYPAREVLDTVAHLMRTAREREGM